MPVKKSLQKKYDAKYDLIKFVLSLFVLAIHASVYPMGLFPWVRIAVPLFFMLSAYFVFSKLHSAPADQQKAILKNFVYRNLRLYLCWFMILLPLTLVKRKELYFSGNLLDNILAFLKSLFFGSTFAASWFISATILGVVILFFLSKGLRNDIAVGILSFLAFCFVTLASSYRSVVADTFLFGAIESYTRFFGYLVCSFPAALFWIFIGKMVAEQKLWRPSWLLLGIFTLCSCICLLDEWRFIGNLTGCYTNDSYFMLAPLCVLLFLGIQKIKPFYWKYSPHFRRASTVIYVTHASIVPVISRFTDKVLNFSHPLLTFLLTFLCCSVICGILEILIQRYPSGKVSSILRKLY